MKPILEPFVEGMTFTGNLLNDVTLFFTIHNDPRTLEHTLKVADEARKIAQFYDSSLMEKSFQAALLHDISNVIPVSKMLDFAESLSIDILEDERRYARSVHQKLSMVMARDIFGITDPEILSAIESHTTHKPRAEMVDKILFVSDKISWELPGEHGYFNEMRRLTYESNIDEAILIYLDSIWDQRDKLKLVHPWLIEAREELMVITGDSTNEISIQTFTKR
ncbi:HD domain-containing protein [Paenibacillus alkalitolerans]|uniref:HD domain-containing protein n=1 Tax=Paenibacillus alkalitolerans TaxID=2799335 RepID=UPI0018F5342F|nr:HD domain-containing protein [Paenibacillus alkalitolerans]